MGVKCFMMHETGKVNLYLRRFTWSKDHDCEKTGFYCDARTDVIDTREVLPGKVIDEVSASKFKDDKRWPTACQQCGRLFSDKDEFQVFQERVYRREDTGEELVWDDAPPGAMRYCWWMTENREDGFYIGPDGQCLMVRCPDKSDWIVDARASNCTRKDDNKHKCWVRHGVPPNITVDKNGDTCAAGAGSIQTKNWHGFLRNGELVE